MANITENNNITEKPQRRVRAEKKPISNAWLTSLADLMSLILTFFVLVYSMSEVPNKEWNIISTALIDFFKGGSIQIKQDYDLSSIKQVLKHGSKKPFDVTYLETLFESLVLEKNAKTVSLEILDNSFIIKFDFNEVAKISEKTQEIELDTNGENLLFNLSKIFSILPNQIEVSTLGDSTEKTILLTDFIAGKVEEFGYEYTVLRIVSDDIKFIEDSGEKIEIIIRPYESYI